MIWTTRDGTNIKVENMSTQHIKNTLRCIENGKISFTINLGYFEDNDFQVIEEDDITKEKWIKIFNNELKRRMMWEDK